MLQLLLQYIELFLEAEAGPEMAGVLHKVLAVLELMLRDSVHRAKAERSPDSVNHILRLFERVSDDDSRLAALRIIALLGSTPESKLEICSREGFKQVLQLLLGKDERVSREVIRILKQLLERTPVPSSRSEGFTTKIKGVFNGVVNLVYGFFPSEEGALTVTIERETPSMPPRDDILRAALNSFEKRKQKYWAEERANSLEGTPVKGEDRKHRGEESKVKGEEHNVKEYIGRQGALGTIAEALHKVAMEEQLDIMETLGMLLTNSIRNQKEFRQLEGYAMISEVLDDIKDYAYNPKSQSFLQSSFRIIQQIVQNGEDSQLVGNIQAFSLLLLVTARCPQELVIVKALETVQSLIEQTWENVLCLYEEDCLQHLERALGRLAAPEHYGTIGTWQSNGSLREIAQGSREQLFRQLDGIMRYASFIMANAHEMNGEILSVYSRVLMRSPSHLQGELLETSTLIVADLNTINPSSSALVRSIYLSAAASISLAVSSVRSLLAADLEPLQQNICLTLLAHIVQYDVRYTEAILSSSLMSPPSTAICAELVLDTELMLHLRSFIPQHPEFEWTYCRMLQTSQCWLDLSPLLRALLEDQSTDLVVRVLMMLDVPHIHSARGSEIRLRFLESLGLEWFSQSLDSISAMKVLVSCVRANSALKTSLVSRPESLKFAEITSPSADLVDLLLELSTEDGYLEAVDKETIIVEALQINDFMQSVLEPKNLIKTSPRSTAPRVVTAPQRPKSLDSIKLLQDSLVSDLIVLLPKASAEVQVHIFSRLTHLAKSYWNKRVLYRLQISKLILSLLSTVTEEALNAAFELLSSVLSYSLTVEEADLMMTLIRDSPWQGRVMSLIKSCLKLDMADSFYVLDRQTQDSPIITGVPKNGYTVVFWLKMRQTSSAASPIFTWVDRNRGLQLLQVAYKHNFPCLEKKASSSVLSPLKTRLPVLTRTLTTSSFITVQAPSTAAFFPSPDDISQFEYELTKDWTHFCVVHGKTGLQVYINGKLCFSYKCSYFGAMKDKHSISGVLGDSSIQTLYAHIHCLEGCLEAQQVRGLYQTGVYATDLRSAGLEGRVVFSLPEEGQRPDTKPLLTIEEGSNAVIVLRQAATKLSDAELGSLHCVSTFKAVLGEVAALPQFISLFHQPVISQALELVAYFITKSPRNYAYFQELGTWTLVVSLLHKHEDRLEPEALELLFSPVTNVIDAQGRLKKLIALRADEIPLICPDRKEGLMAICDLLELLPPDKISGLLECLANLLYVPQNASAFLSSEVNGLQVLCSLCSHYIYDSRYRHLKFLILTLFERVTPSLSGSKDLFLTYLEFLSTQEPKSDQQTEGGVIEGLICLLSIHVVTNSISLNDFKPDELLVVFNLLNSSSEHTRVAALKFIGMMLWSSPKFEMWFKKTSGFDFILKTLAVQTNSKLTYNVLFLISQNALDRVSLFYPEDAGLLQTVINNSSIADKTLPPLTQKPEAKILAVDAIRVIVSLLKEDSDETHKLTAFSQIERLIETDPENMRTLMDSNFLLWCAELLHPNKVFSLAPAYSEAESDSKVFELLNTMSLYDLYRPPKHSRLAGLLKRLSYEDDIEQKLLGNLLESVQSSPCVDLAPAETFFKNLISLLSKNELLSIHSGLCVQVMQLVNVLAAANKPQVRAKMKDLGFFDLRDSLLIQLVRCEQPSADLRRLLAADDTCFHSVASLIKFRDSLVPLYMTRLMLGCPGDGLQAALLRILKEGVCSFEENCKVMKKAIEHKPFLDFMFNYKSVEESGALLQCFKSMRQRPEDLGEEPLPENCSDAEFLAWLNTEERLRSLTVQLNKKLVPIDSEIKRNILRTVEVRTTRINANFESQLAEMTRVRKTIQPNETSLMNRTVSGDRRYRDSVQVQQRQMTERSSAMKRNSL
jgi:hypothetical protein